MDNIAEQTVIANALTNEDSWIAISESLTADHFFDYACREIYKTMSILDASGQTIEPVNVADRMGGDWLETVIDLVQNALPVRSLGSYIKIIEDNLTQRRLSAAGRRVIEIAESEAGLDEKVSEAAQVISEIESSKNKTGPAHIMESMRGLADEYDSRWQSKGGIVGLATGYEKLDQRFCGLKPGNLLLLAGRPAMGKSTLAMNLVEHCVMTGGASLVFTLEMPAAQIRDRMIASVGRIPLQLIKTGEVVADETHSHKLVPAAGRISQAPLYVDDSSSLTIQELRARARKINRKEKLSLIMVDYIQLMNGVGGNREQEISGISRGLKQLAGELGCPVIALSQLNRSLEQRPNKRPIMSDLRESGSLEQDADIIVFVYRDEIYNEDTQQKGVAEVITRKFRDGEIGTDYLSAQLHMSRFDNLSPELIQQAMQDNQPKQKPQRRGFDG